MAQEPRDPRSNPRSPEHGEDPDVRRRAAFLEQELELLRAKVAESPRHMRLLEDRLAEAQTRVGALSERNERLAETLREARDQMVALKEEIDRLAQPPSGYGIFLELFEDGTVDIFTSGRKLRVACVGMGSNLVTGDLLKAGDYAGIAAKVNGHVFAGLFGRSTMIWLPERDRADALVWRPAPQPLV